MPRILFLNSRVFWCWHLVFAALASRSGIAFTAAANQHPLAAKALVRGGATRSQSQLEVSSGSYPDESMNEIQLGQVEEENRGPLKVLFLSADTGGGHRASAESLAAQFLNHFPGSTYDLLDIWTLDGVYPYKTLVKSYTHLSARPRQWKILYHWSNTWFNEKFADWHSHFASRKKIRRRIASYDPDVVVCVHPAMSGGPSYELREIGKLLGKHIPFFIVVTDLGTAHATWFRSKNTDKIYVASDRIRKLAKRRGRFPDDKIVKSGLPIRQAFADESTKLGDRTTEAGKAYQAKVRENLLIDTDRKIALVMGGGEGVGGLEEIVDELYTSFMKQGLKASIYVVCGRNEKLKQKLANKDWDRVLRGEHKPIRKRTKIARFFKKLRGKYVPEDPETKNAASGDVKVVGLGFVTQMAEYMVAADVLVTKAGPGTIAEAAAVGLPVMLTSFLPGQEAGNVDVVLESGFGEYCDDPVAIGQEVASWLNDDDLMGEMSRQAKKAGRPDAAKDIVLDIGTTANAWKSISNSRRMTELKL